MTPLRLMDKSVFWREENSFSVSDFFLYLWYVMEKAKLVLVKEKRALATPLELGSHESVMPVNTATKSADVEKVFGQRKAFLHWSSKCICLRTLKTFPQRYVVSYI